MTTPEATNDGLCKNGYQHYCPNCGNSFRAAVQKPTPAATDGLRERLLADIDGLLNSPGYEITFDVRRMFRDARVVLAAKDAELATLKAERDELKAVLELVADCDADSFHTCGFRVTAERALGRQDA